ncbi:hypothetical protein [Comamonas sp.]|uniref:hypothetical protein n=1 Tax=Comamonas sp. TaxID=34028 RepID=UPI0028A7ED53|nr:hypothetical protein [Comamonas sp.]
MPKNTEEIANKTACKTTTFADPKNSNAGAKDQKATEAGATINSLVAPVPRIQQTERCDDPLACLAMLSNKTLEQITALAYDAGYPRHGPAYIPDEMLVALAMKSGGWVAKIYKEFISFSQLPAIAILYVDYSEVVDLGRTVLWMRPPSAVAAQHSKPPVLAKINGESSLTSMTQSPSGSASTLDLGAGFIIDPAYWITPDQQIITGITPVHFEPMWYMELNSKITKDI